MFGFDAQPRLADEESQLRAVIQQSLVEQQLKPFQAAIVEFKSTVSEDTFSKGISLLRKIAQNLLKDKPKYRQLKQSNPKLKEMLFQYPAGRKLVNTMGFLSSDKDKDKLIMRPDFTHATFTACLSQLRGVPIKAPTTSLKPQTNTASQSVSFKALATSMKPQANTASQNFIQNSNTEAKSQPFSPSAWLKRSNSEVQSNRRVKKKRKKATHCRLIIRFEDRQEYTVTYKAEEQIKDLWDWISPKIKYPYFELKVIGTRTTIREEDSKMTFEEKGLCPSAVMVVQTKGGVVQGHVDVNDVRRGLVDISQLDYEQMLELESQLGTVSTKAISESSLKRVGLEKKYSLTEDEAKMQDEERMCAVCRDVFEDGDVIRVLHCDHRYHKKCIDYWLTSEKGSCPECHTLVRSKSGKLIQV